MKTARPVDLQGDIEFASPVNLSVSSSHMQLVSASVPPRTITDKDTHRSGDATDGQTGEETPFAANVGQPGADSGAGHYLQMIDNMTG